MQRRGDAHASGQTKVAPGQCALHGKHGLVHALGVPQQLLAGRSGHVTLGQAFEDPYSQLVLEGIQPPEHGGMIHPKLARGARQSAAPGNGENHPQVVPTESR